MNRSEAQRARREKEAAERRSQSQLSRRTTERGQTERPITLPLAKRETTERGQTPFSGLFGGSEGKREKAPFSSHREPLYAEGTFQGRVYSRVPPRPIGWFDTEEDAPKIHRLSAKWQWGDVCPECLNDTEFGYCTVCVWVCPNEARPASEPIVVGP